MSILSKENNSINKDREPSNSMLWEGISDNSVLLTNVSRQGEMGNKVLKMKTI